jgi:hypothetical protein
MSVSLGMIALLAALHTAPVAPAPPQDETRLGDIVVNGRPLDELVGDFVDEISRPASQRGLARWQGRVCVGVVNLPAAYAQTMVDRVSDVAARVGLEPGEPGCRPGIVIVATDDGSALATAMVRRRNSGFDIGSHQTDAGSRALREFQTSDRAVRWWHTSLPIDSNNGQVAIRLPGMTGPDGQPSYPQLSVFAASRLNTQVRDNLARIVIIVDVTKLGDTTFDQLSDYVALLSLAQIDADAQTGNFDTIMNIFSDAGGPATLTDWDMGYLEALYSTHPDRIDPNALTRSVAGEVARGIRANQAEPEG